MENQDIEDHPEHRECLWPHDAPGGGQQGPKGSVGLKWGRVGPQGPAGDEGTTRGCGNAWLMQEVMGQQGADGICRGKRLVCLEKTA
ncbi:unnamed protein product, partial [Mesorhabditis belari]|uniref:Uncharacterized protein n=1 Tax=Mesorhabditis belari TaxID=2138241 RepID=A0AAF3JBL3_9BILA